MSKTALDATSERIESLQLKHRELDRTVDEMSNQWGVDQQEIQALKKRKLQIKDEITRLQSQT